MSKSPTKTTRNYSQQALSTATSVDYLSFTSTISEISHLKQDAKRLLEALSFLDKASPTYHEDAVHLARTLGQYKPAEQIEPELGCRDEFFQFEEDISVVNPFKEKKANWQDLYRTMLRQFGYDSMVSKIQHGLFETKRHSEFEEELDKKLRGEVEYFIEYMNHCYSWANYAHSNDSGLCDGNAELKDVQPFSLQLNFSGRYSYKHSANILFHGINIGIACWGSNNFGYLISLTGSGCQHANLKNVYTYLVQNDCTITRADIAFDDLHGNRNIDWYKDQMETGGFNKTNQTPSYTYIESGQIVPRGDRFGFDQSAGRTFYVGKRQNGKMGRFYEKGIQMQSEEYPDWVRAEIELRNKDRVIPLDIIVNPDPYFADQYPCLNFVSEEVKPIGITRIKVTATAEHLIEAAAKSYGKLVRFLQDVHQLNSEEIITRLTERIPISDSPSQLYPKRILQAF